MTGRCRVAEYLDSVVRSKSSRSQRTHIFIFDQSKVASRRDAEGRNELIQQKQQIRIRQAVTDEEHLIAEKKALKQQKAGSVVVDCVAKLLQAEHEGFGFRCTAMRLQ